MKIAFRITVIVFVVFCFFSCSQERYAQWQDDFKTQPIVERPGLEVSYTDSSRTAFQVLAQEYQVTGQLRKPHLLLDGEGMEWLWLEMEDADGTIYSTRFYEKPSRINLYRRGPYFNEIHWFDIQPTTEEGIVAPIRGDLTLYCYPEKILAEIIWHGVGDFNATNMQVRGLSPLQFDCQPFSDNTKQSFAFPLYGEEEPLADDALVLHEGETPLRYNSRKGYYDVGTVSEGRFQENFYNMPNKYETAVFSITNDAKPRKIYICHESVVGGGFVEGGMVLDKERHPMPIVVQISKNFSGEKEEKFYNPLDTAFSETFFPLYLEPYEQVTLSSLHLYQNWGRKMTKHWSSLGAWMDYFHSSTGMTETTCYVPFKFAGIGGVAIADFRAMSQKTFWKGQPQHDNIAGHSFLSFFDGQSWQHSKYESTIYRSTGPNWFDIQMNYTSADGSIRVVADLWETPQADELRSFFRVRYEVLRPITIADAQANFRFLDVTSRIQSLKYTRFATNGIDDMEIDFSESPFPIKGHQLPSENAYLAVYGDSIQERGSNAVIIRSFSGPNGIGPAVSLQTGPYLNRFRMDGESDTRLMLVPDVDTLELKEGDVFEIDGFWLPYGSRDDAETPRRELIRYANDQPSVTSCKRGTIIADLPVTIKAHRNKAEFSIKGGKELLPVIITGLTDWRFPRIWKQEGRAWRLLSHSRNWDHDGYQVFVDEDGTFGAVFLVYADHQEQTLRVSAGKSVPEPEKITLKEESALPDGQRLRSIDFSRSFMKEAVGLSFPPATAHSEGASTISWLHSEGQSLWFESQEGSWARGGRMNPNADDIDLEYWWQNNAEGMIHDPPQFLMNLTGTHYEDKPLERTFYLLDGVWKKVDNQSDIPVSGLAAIAIQSADGSDILCMAWPNAERIISRDGVIAGVSLEPLVFDLSRRYHVRGKVFLFEGSLDTLLDRISKEMPLVEK